MLGYNHTDLLKAYLQNIKNINGVENVVLTQRDGFPVNSAGVWLSQKEIFNVSSATSAIYAVAENITGNNLDNILVEGVNAKIFLSPLPKTKEYFITLTAKSKANLGAIYVEAKNSVESLQEILLSNNLNFKPPLRFYSEAEISEILDNFSIKENQEEIDNFSLSRSNLSITGEIIEELNHYIQAITKSIPNVESIFITINGGHTVASFSKKLFEDKSFAVMVYSLYDTANRVYWVLKRSYVTQILCESKESLLFVYGLKGAILSITIKKKSNLRIGLLRILFASYVKALNAIFEKAKELEGNVPIIEFGNTLQSLVVK